jgi:hypothetical protein
MLSEFQKSLQKEQEVLEEKLQHNLETKKDEESMEEDSESSNDLPADKETNEEGAVSSTVTIATPEANYDVSAKGDPTVWKGDIDMPDVAKFSVSAHAVSGTTDYLTVDLRDSLKIVGRIAPDTVWDYIAQVTEAQTKEILVLRLQPSSADEKDKYDSFYEYLDKRKRFGVVGNFNKTVKDCYIFPLDSESNIHSCLMPLEGPGLEVGRPNMLLALIVRSRRKRPADLERKYREYVQAKRKQRASTEKRKPSSDEQKGDDYVPYDPSMAGHLDVDDSTPSPGEDGDNTEEIYDPESASFDESNEPAAKKPKGSSDDPSFSPPQDDLDQIPGLDGKIAPIISADTGGFTEQLAKLNKAIEEQKAENERLSAMDSKTDAESAPKSSDIGPATVKGFQGLPSSIATLLFQAGSEQASAGDRQAAATAKKSLSAMSDADLDRLVKSQEMDSFGPPAQKGAKSPNMFPPMQPGPSTDGFGPPQWGIPSAVGGPPMQGGPPPNMLGAPPPGPWMQGFEPRHPPPPPHQWQQGHDQWGGPHDHDQEWWNRNRDRWKGDHHYGDGGDHRRGGHHGGRDMHHHHHHHRHGDSRHHRHHRDRDQRRGHGHGDRDRSRHHDRRSNSPSRTQGESRRSRTPPRSAERDPRNDRDPRRASTDTTANQGGTPTYDE